MKRDGIMSITAQLVDVLTQEKNALVKGDFETLQVLSETKADLLDRIHHEGDATDDDLAVLHDGLTRNRTLLNSALKGIRAVSDRIAELKQVRHRLETYDRAGQKKSVATRLQTTLEKRA